MKVEWSPHAVQLLDDIIIGIATELYPDDGLRWEAKLQNAANRLADFPESCPNVPLECFDVIPPNPERLRQLIVRPYRIVYEVVGDECHILSIRHSRMLVTVDDTAWH